MKKTLKSRKIIVLLVVLCIAMLVSTLTINDSVSHNTAYAASESVNDSLTLTLTSDGTGYKVLARNKQLTSVRIPETYNDLPVKEIADNGFTNCTNLKEVWIPHTVTRIGNNAFANCKNLELICGMPKVEYVGNNAFAMCTKLDNLILPNTINSLGSTILRNNPNKVYSRMSEEQMRALNANWIANSTGEVIYGNELVLTEIAEEVDGELQITGYSITMQQNLNTDVDFILGDTYNGLPLLEIEQYAFYYSEFKSFTLKHGIIDPVTEEEKNEAIEEGKEFPIKGFTPLETECKHTINIKSGAFYGMTTNYIDILVNNVTFEDSEVDDPTFLDYENGHSIEIFTYSTARGITLPNNITYIPKSMFEYCMNLREIKSTDPFVDVNRISNNITTIGSDAFTGCTALLNLYIPNSVTTMGNSVFTGWGDSEVNQTVYFNDIYEAPVGVDGYDWNPNWQGTTYENFKAQFKTISIVFDKDGGKEGVGTNGVSAMYNQEMPNAVAPERDYYDFGGYFSKRNGEGAQYYDENMASVENWDKKDATVLYAYWIPHTFTVIFDKDGGIGGSDYVIASYEQSMPSAIKPTKTGYNFLGYYIDSIQYYDESMNSANYWDFAENGIVLTAQWETRRYHVILNEQKDLTHDIVATYLDPMPPASIPTKAGKIFMGYFTEPDGQGTQYYDENMESARNWDIDSEYPVDLYAYWILKNYTITIHNQDETLTIDNIYYEDEFPTLKLEVPKKFGYEFKGFYSESGDIYYTNEMKPTHTTYNIDGNLDLYPDLEIIVYNIQYELKGGINNPQNPSSFTVDDNLILAEPTNTPLAFLYWTYDDAEISGNMNDLVKDLNEYVRVIKLSVEWTDTHIITIDGPFIIGKVSLPIVKIYCYGVFDTNCTIKVASTTQSIEIYGNGRSYNMNIVVDDASENLSIHLSFITITGHSNRPAISAPDSSTLNLYTYNDVKIYGTSNSNGDGVCAISCGILNIKAADSLLIKGGDGKNGDIAENGGNAGAGIVCGTTNIQCSKVKISAGSAGDGGNFGFKLQGSKLVLVPDGGYGGKGSKAVIGELIIYEGQTANIVDSEDGKDGTSRLPQVIPVIPPINSPANPPIM